MAPLVVGMVLGPRRPGAVASLDEAGVRALARRLPLRGVRAALLGPAEIAGDWRIDGTPTFDPTTGQFAGYQGRMRRWELGLRPARQPDTAGRMRQVLHELRTPVNAIQGFAELIQQQMFGAAPNEYRALAAAVAVDAARLMAGFDEIDRLARLESGALQLEEGRSDLREVLGETLRRLEGVLKPRSARIELIAEGSPFTVPIERIEAMQLAWRLIATLAGAMAPGEIIDLKVRSDGARVTVDADLPGSMLGNGDLFAASTPPQARAVSAGMFGSGFTFRLARAEAEAAGGSLDRHEDCVRLVLPVLTAVGDALDREGGGGSSAA
jgi:two-component system, OmpR family, sensor kinase